MIHNNSAENLAPVVLFVYNRPKHTQLTVEALQQNQLADKSELIIYSDGPRTSNDTKRVKQVRDYLSTIDGFNRIRIVQNIKNLGLAKSIISGVTEVINEYGRVIVLEDDIVTSPYFLSYMNRALSFYESDTRIYSITGLNYLNNLSLNYEYDVYLSFRSSSWGWGTWKNRWDNSDWDMDDYEKFKKDKYSQQLFNQGGDDLTDMLIAQMEKNLDSWSIIWCYSHYKNGAFCLCPVYNFVNNIGLDSSGIHCGEKNNFSTLIDDNKGKIKLERKIEVSEYVVDAIKSLYKRSWKKRINKQINTLYASIKNRMNTSVF